MAQEHGVDGKKASGQGLDPGRLNDLAKAIEQDTAKGLYDGATVLVARGGEVVMHGAIGNTDLEKKRVASKEDVFFVMSITKQLTTATVLMRIDRGELNLMTPVAEIIPEFGIKGKRGGLVYSSATNRRR